MKMSFVRCPLSVVRCIFFGAAFFFTCSIALRGGPENPKATDNGQRTTDDEQTLIFFSETRPILIRLHVRVDGRPLQIAWDEFTRSVFQSLDTNKDDTLSREEAEKTPPAQVLFGSNAYITGALPTFDQLDADHDGKVTLDELRSYYRRNGGAAFQINAAPVVRRNVASPSTDALNDALFKLLDADKDGKLSKEELAQAPFILMQKDEDDDEIIEPHELAVAPNPYGPLPAPAREDKSRVIVPTFRTVNPGDSPTELARQFLARYGPKGQAQAHKLTRKEIGLDEATFNQLDVDGDGELDTEELTRFTRRPPDIELSARLGQQGIQEAIESFLSKGGKKALAIVPGKDRPLTANLRMSNESTLVLDLGTTRVEIQPGSGRVDTVSINNSFVIERLKLQFKMADKDNKGYLTMNEARPNRFFGPLFKLMDADNDGKLYEKEMVAYLDRMGKLQEKALAACVTLGVSDEGRGLFDLIDTNRDGRLSLREMRNAVNLIKTFDRDGDGKLSKEEIPQCYQAAVHRGTSSTTNSLPREAQARAGSGTGRGPVWFRNMDLNRDGDVSRREFLGTDQQFKEIDTDGDGLISIEEAEAYDKKNRQNRGAK